ncbi:tyrosine-type recombinase/integrase [Shimia thalassica]|uniref:tyrosine-type recombinase/integrase n=1 Tax=Shimia thalassica TaxID=1715693 RepID=UPI0026E2530A|nr:site-specific integrase [Shimia thalassica]MDO6481934.1 integrase arm-type DNA-binding domain-containing protein [Shimia thalassica]
MSRAKHKLSATKIRNAEAGTFYDGGGLQLQKTSKSSGKWIYRYSFLGQRRDMGLGAFPVISLADARAARDRWENCKNANNDPIEVRNTENAKILKQKSKFNPMFEEAVDACLKHNAASLKNGGEAGKWRSPLRLHAIPKLGRKRVSNLTVGDIKGIIEPLWIEKHPTAEKIYQRVRMVLQYCANYNADVDPDIVNQAIGQLPKIQHETESIVATPWQEVPALYKRLNKITSGELAMRFLILTVCRADSVCGARFDEIDGDIWTVPVSRMKGKEGKTKDFRVPLSSEAMRVVEICKQRRSSEYLFLGHRGRPIIGNTLLEVLNDLDELGRPHGFRSSFKDWTREIHSGLWELAETSLNHKIGDKTERSYHRSDLLEPRRKLIASWSEFVAAREQPQLTVSS